MILGRPRIVELDDGYRQKALFVSARTRVAVPSLRPQNPARMAL